MDQVKRGNRLVPPDEADGQDAEPAAEGDHERLGSEYHAQAQGRECREHDAGKFAGGRPGLRPS